MDCLTCTHLLQAFESKLSKYIEARSAAYYRVSTELAAHKNVDTVLTRIFSSLNRPIGRPARRRAVFGERPSSWSFRGSVLETRNCSLLHVARIKAAAVLDAGQQKLPA
jgi:hypothetical protein